MNKKIFIAALLIGSFSFSLLAQTNYFGVTGNMVSGDFDNDGFNDDIAAFNTAEELPKLNLWIGNESWVSEEEGKCILPFDFLNAKSLNSKIVSGDFDNDGFIDDIASIYEIGLNKTSVTVWINTDGEFKPSQWWYGPDFDANQIAQTIVSGDFDNDGFIDDIAAFYDYEQKRTKVYVWKSDSEKFAWPGTWWIGNDFNSTKVQGTIVSGDFDHDGFKDDIATLYNYIDDYCKAFVWVSDKNKFRWPYTWFAQENFAAKNIVGNVISGDFNGNGFEDNIAALYKDDENSSSILVFEKGKGGFSSETWWFGNNEAISANARLVATDFNNSKTHNQFSGLVVENQMATLKTWTAENRQFDLPESNWEGIALSVENCEQDGNCLPNELGETFEIYPNPSNGNFTIDIPALNESQVQVTIYNIVGSLVKTLQVEPGQKFPVNMTDFEKGTYMIQISDDNLNYKQTLIIE